MRGYKQGLALCGALLLGITLLFGCSKSADKAATAEEAATAVLEQIYSADAEDTATFTDALAQSADDEKALDNYLDDKVGDQLSDTARDALLNNRVISRVLTTWPDSAVTVSDVALQDAYTATDTQQMFSYLVTAAPDGQDPQTFAGEIALTKTDDVWQVTGIT